MGVTLPAMVDRHRLVIAALIVAVGAGLYALGSGPASLGGTVLPGAPPAAEVSVAPADAEPGTVAVRFAGTGTWTTATLVVDWNASLRVVEGDRRLEQVGETVTLAEATESGATHVRLTVTAIGDGTEQVVYRETIRI